MGALCDPSSADVTGRILEAFGLLLRCADKERLNAVPIRNVKKACDRGLAYLQKTQEEDGKWYGRWGSNYVYGTSNALCGLSFFLDDANEHCKVRSMCDAALEWLKGKQNADGGWGEDLVTYKDPTKAGIGPSTPSQTAWGLMGLLPFLDPGDDSIESAVVHLLDTQTEVKGQGASWPETRYTGTGFPGFFYLGYTLYRHYFPMMALGRWARSVRADVH